MTKEDKTDDKKDRTSDKKGTNKREKDKREGGPLAFKERQQIKEGRVYQTHATWASNQCMDYQTCGLDSQNSAAPISQEFELPPIE